MMTFLRTRLRYSSIKFIACNNQAERNTVDEILHKIRFNKNVRSGRAKITPNAFHLLKHCSYSSSTSIASSSSYSNNDKTRKSEEEDSNNKQAFSQSKQMAMLINDDINKSKDGSEPSVSSATASSSSDVIDPGEVTFQDFLDADTNKDGRVTAAEWESYLAKKKSINHETRFQGISIELPIPMQDGIRMLESEGIHVTVNGMRYAVSLKPVGTTEECLIEKQELLGRLIKELSELRSIQAPLDVKAANYTKRVLTGVFLYLISQATLIAKLTFFSRFGWDVMEPVCLFHFISMYLYFCIDFCTG